MFFRARRYDDARPIDARFLTSQCHARGRAYISVPRLQHDKIRLSTMADKVDKRAADASIAAEARRRFKTPRHWYAVRHARQFSALAVSRRRASTSSACQHNKH